MSTHRSAAWIIRAEWINSSDTYHGAFEFADEAEQWAADHLYADDACTTWHLAILSPVCEPAR